MPAPARGRRAGAGARVGHGAEVPVAGRGLPGDPAAADRHRDGVVQDRATSTPAPAPFDAARRLAQLRTTTSPRSPSGKMLLGFVNTLIILVDLGRRHHPHRLDGGLRDRPVRVPAEEGRSSALFLLATLVPGVTTQVATFQVVNELGPLQHPMVGDRAVPGHRHRLHLHLPAVPARHPPRARRVGRAGGRQPRSPSTGGSSCR